MINPISYDRSATVITGQLLRAARGLLGVTAQEVANGAGVGVATIRRAETTDGPVRATMSNIDRVVTYFAGHGVIFIPEDDHGAGVRWAKPARPALRR